jgi:hypothetical protein
MSPARLLLVRSQSLFPEEILQCSNLEGKNSMCLATRRRCLLTTKMLLMRATFCTPMQGVASNVQYKHGQTNQLNLFCVT